MQQKGACKLGKTDWPAWSPSLAHLMPHGPCHAPTLTTALLKGKHMTLSSAAATFACFEGLSPEPCCAQANIMKMADGLFLRCCREVHEKYPDIQYRELIVSLAHLHSAAVLSVQPILTAQPPLPGAMAPASYCWVFERWCGECTQAGHRSWSARVTEARMHICMEAVGSCSCHTRS